MNRSELLCAYLHTVNSQCTVSFPTLGQHSVSICQRALNRHEKKRDLVINNKSFFNGGKPLLGISK